MSDWRRELDGTWAEAIEDFLDMPQARPLTPPSNAARTVVATQSTYLAQAEALIHDGRRGPIDHLRPAPKP